MTDSTNPPLPADEGVVTQLRALGVLYNGWVQCGPNGHFAFDDAAGVGWHGDQYDEAEMSQMGMRLDQAIADGHAERIGEPDEDGYRQLRLTDAGIAVLDQAVAEQRHHQGSP